MARPRRLVAVVAAVVALGHVGPTGAVVTTAHAAETFVVDTVDDDPSKDACTAVPDDCSLRGALAEAAAAGPGEDLVDLHSELPDPATISLVAPLVVDGHHVTIVGRPEAPDSITVDGVDAARILLVEGVGGVVDLAGVTLANGRSADGVGAGRGGGLYVLDDASVSLTDVRVVGNVAEGADDADGLALAGGGAAGGGIHVRGVAELTRVRLEGNLARAGDGYDWNSATPGIDATIGGNAFGGGLYVEANATVQLTDVELVDNEARGGAAGSWGSGIAQPVDKHGKGGGAAVGSAIDSRGTLTGEGVTVDGGLVLGRSGSASSIAGTEGSGGNGGAARAALRLDGTVNLVDVAVTGHQASGGAGGIGRNGQGGLGGDAVGGVYSTGGTGTVDGFEVRDTTATAGAAGRSAEGGRRGGHAHGIGFLNPSDPLVVANLVSAGVTALGGNGLTSTSGGDGGAGGDAELVALREEAILDGWTSSGDVAVGGDGGDGGPSGAAGGDGGDAVGVRATPYAPAPLSRVRLSGTTLRPGSGGSGTEAASGGGPDAGAAGVGIGVDVQTDADADQLVATVSVVGLSVEAADGGDGGNDGSTLASGGDGGDGSTAAAVRVGVRSGSELAIEHVAVLDADLRAGSGGTIGLGGPGAQAGRGGTAAGLLVDVGSGPAGGDLEVANATLADLVVVPGDGALAAPDGDAGALVTAPGWTEHLLLTHATLGPARTDTPATAPGAAAVVLGQDNVPTTVAVDHGVLAALDGPTCALGGGSLAAVHSVATGSCGAAHPTYLQGVDPADLALGAVADAVADDGVPTLRLGGGSLALDHGVAGTCPLPVDGRGAARPADGDGDGQARCDAGAYEHVPVVPDPDPDPGPGGIDRLAGDTRVETAVLASQAAFDQASTVVIARSDTYPDALAGAPLAHAEQAPILLTPPSGLHEAVAAEVQRLGATTSVLLGGQAALSDQVATDLEDLGVVPERVAGDDRYATAALVADRVIGDGTEVFVTEGQHADRTRGWPDALGVGPWAAVTSRPILLTVADRLPDRTAAALADLGVTRVTVVGGEAAVSASVAQALDGLVDEVDRLAGPDRYATAALVAEQALADGLSPTQTWLATGGAFPDALAAGPAVAAVGGSLLLVHPRELDRSPATADWLVDHATEVVTVRILGGDNAIAPEVAAAVEGLLP